MAAVGLAPDLLLTLLEIALRGFDYGVSASFTITGTPGAERRILGNHHFDKRSFGPRLSHVISPPSSVSHPAAKVSTFNALHI